MLVPLIISPHLTKLTPYRRLIFGLIFSLFVQQVKINKSSEFKQPWLVEDNHL